MPKFKNLVNFSDSKPLKGDKKHFSHEIRLFKKIKNQKNWYFKHLGGNINEAFIEMIAQEFFRLILPYHPKTRIAIAKDAGSCYVLSKEILNFNANFFLFPNNNKFIINGQITGLAAAQLLALLVNEIDFKPCNVGVADGKVIKIDGGLCFASLNSHLNSLLQGKNTRITQTDIEALPALVHYEASNWLNLIKWNPKKKRAEKNLPAKQDFIINQMPNFKHELYQTILRVILLPDELIHFFTQSYTPDGISLHYKNCICNKLTAIANTLIIRKHQLAQAAYQIPAFNDYRFSNAAHEEIVAYLQQLKEFKTIGSSILLADFKEKFNVNIEEIILINSIEEYIPIKKFFQELHLYQMRLNDPLSFESLSLLVTENRKRIASYLEEVKPIFNQNLKLEKIVYFNELYKILFHIRETLNFLSPNCLFISQIDSLLRQLEQIKTTSNQNKFSNHSSFFIKRNVSTPESYFLNKKSIPNYYTH